MIYDSNWRNKTSSHVLCIFKIGQFSWSCQLGKRLSILQSAWNSMDIILLEQHIMFLLQEWQHDRLNNILDIHAAVQNFLECDLFVLDSFTTELYCNMHHCRMNIHLSECCNFIFHECEYIWKDCE